MTTTRRDWLKAVAVSLAAGPRLVADDGKAAVPGATMAAAAERFLAALTDDQRAKVRYAIGDPERYNWHFVPLQDAKTKLPTRKGVPLDAMSAAAKSAALDLLRTGTSADGFKWCQDIMAREAILAELEPQNAWLRKPGWYFVTVFGTPGATVRWGWRLEGHHMSVNVAVDAGRIVSASPLFLGVNPVTIKHGPRRGERETIAPCEDLGRELFRSLDAGQQSAARLPKHLPEVAGRTARAPDLPTGVAASTMTAAQKRALESLVAHYTGRMPADLAKVETDRLHAAGLEKVTFAYSGEAQPGQRHTYVVQGPTFVIHYLNEQTDPQRNPANHIHSIYRSRAHDFGGIA